MNFYIPKCRSPIIKVNDVPKQYSQFRMSAAQPLYVKGTFGDYLTQIIRASGYHIQFNIFNFVTDKEICPYSNYSIIPLHFMLEGDIKCFLEGFGEAWLSEKCINLLYIPGRIYHKASFKAGFYRSFHIDFSPRAFRHLAGRYPELNDVLTRHGGHSPAGIQQHTSYITPVVQKIVNEVLRDCPAKEPDLSVFAEIKSKELLLKYIQNPSADTSSVPASSKAHIEQIAAFIEAHLDYPFTIRLLATMFTTNETMLKKRFKQYTGQTIYTFLLGRRMEKALNLIEAHRFPIGDIALQVGYDDFSSFDRAFSHHFGHSPAFYRKT